MVNGTRPPQALHGNCVFPFNFERKFWFEMTVPTLLIGSLFLYMVRHVTPRQYCALAWHLALLLGSHATFLCKMTRGEPAAIYRLPSRPNSAE